MLSIIKIKVDFVLVVPVGTDKPNTKQWKEMKPKHLIRRMFLIEKNLANVPKPNCPNKIFDSRQSMVHSDQIEINLFEFCL